MPSEPGAQTCGARFDAAGAAWPSPRPLCAQRLEV